MKVSVAMITYNHERYIAEAIESVLMQETSFDYELVIGEDCSTDRTRQIVIDYRERFPQKIRLLLPETNLGLHENLVRVYKACEGQYIALLEGDDYWTSPQKLQKQVDFLDTHPMCSMCFHPVRWFYEDDLERSYTVWPENPKELFSFEDILRTIFIQTGSVMLRNGILKEYPRWFHKLRGADWPLFILLAHQGKIGCIQEVMGDYRKHPGGVAYRPSAETRYTDFIDMYECVNSHFKFRYAKIIRPILVDYYFKLAVVYDQRGDAHLARRIIRKNLAAHLLNRQKPNLNEVKMFMRLSFPSFYSLLKRIIKASA